jgi:hypothetical protein
MWLWLCRSDSVVKLSYFNVNYSFAIVTLSIRKRMLGLAWGLLYDAILQAQGGNCHKFDIIFKNLRTFAIRHCLSMCKEYFCSNVGIS